MKLKKGLFCLAMVLVMISPLFLQASMKRVVQPIGKKLIQPYGRLKFSKNVGSGAVGSGALTHSGDALQHVTPAIDYQSGNNAVVPTPIKFNGYKEGKYDFNWSKTPVVAVAGISGATIIEDLERSEEALRQENQRKNATIMMLYQQIKHDAKESLDKYEEVFDLAPDSPKALSLLTLYHKWIATLSREELEDEYRGVTDAFIQAKEKAFEDKWSQSLSWLYGNKEKLYRRDVDKFDLDQEISDLGESLYHLEKKSVADLKDGLSSLKNNILSMKVADAHKFSSAIATGSSTIAKGAGRAIKSESSSWWDWMKEKVGVSGNEKNT